MKIFAISDFHDGRNGVETAELICRIETLSPDLLVLGGDIDHFGNMSEVLRDALQESDPPLVHVPGNHELHRCTDLLLPRAIDLTKSTWVFGEVGFVGVDLWEPGTTDRPRQIPEEELRDIIRRADLLQVERLVVVAHGVPCGYPGAPRGMESQVLTKILRALRPDVAILGHLHEPVASDLVIDGTRCILPGPGGYVLEL